jgi:hypothetical protein
MRRLLPFLLLATFMLPVSGAAQSPSGPDAPLPGVFAGEWRSAPYEVALASDADREIWGEGAKSVRTTEMTIDAKAHGTLNVTRRVVNARGRTIAGSTMIEHVVFDIGAIEHPVGLRPYYTTRITSAEREYPELNDRKWPVEGFDVRLIAPADPSPMTVEIRLETPEGDGSFSETLEPARAHAPARRNTANS